jgi:hypothetical protein
MGAADTATDKDIILDQDTAIAVDTAGDTTEATSAGVVGTMAGAADITA